MTAPSQRSRSVDHFLVMEILERAQELEGTGTDVIHLEVGEPDFSTPRRAHNAAVDALEAGHTHYTHSLGIKPLREAIAQQLEADYGSEVDPDRIVVTMGSSAAILLAFATLLDPGDEVIVSDPGYACYPNIARFTGAIPRAVPAGEDEGFVLAPDAVAAALTPRTGAIVVNSPSNPTGRITPPHVLRALADLGPAVVSDEIYHGLVYEDTAHSMLEYSDQCFIAGGFSKKYAMTGWRLGYLVAPLDYVRVVQAMQQNLFISASDFGQWAALEALKATDDVARMQQRFDERRRYLLQALPSLGLRVPVRPQGAFYIFADARRFTNDSMAFAIELLEETGVAVAPGVDFGLRGQGWIRISYATALERIQDGVERLATYLRGR